jgi:hypothetical protein
MSRIAYVPVSILDTTGNTVVKPNELVVLLDGKEIGELAYEPYGVMWFFAPGEPQGERFTDLVILQTTLEERHPDPARVDEGPLTPEECACPGCGEDLRVIGMRVWSKMDICQMFDPGRMEYDTGRDGEIGPSEEWFCAECDVALSERVGQALEAGNFSEDPLPGEDGD